MSDDAEVERLRAEVERLRARDEAQARTGGRRAVARRAGRVLLLVLGCGLAALAALAIWARVVLLDTDRYVETVAPLAQKPDVQQAIADRLGDRLTAAVDGEAYAAELLPPRAQPLAAPIGAGLDQLIRTEVGNVVRSDEFARVWDDANRKAHALVIELLTGEQQAGAVSLQGDAVTLDVGVVVDRAQQRLRARGLDRLADRIPPVNREVVLVRSSALASASDAVRLLKTLAIVLPVLALAALAGSVWLAPGRRRRAILQAALGVTLAMLLLLAGLAFARSAYLDAVSDLPQDAAATVFDELVRFLRDGLRIVVAVAVLVAIVAALLGRPLGGWARGVAARVGAGAPARWVAAHRGALQLGVAGIGGLVLLAQNTPTATTVLVILAVVLVLVLLVDALARTAAPPAVPG